MTAVLVQVNTDGSAIVVNCGHPAPLLVRGGQATELDPPEPAPPLGLGPHPEPLRLTLALGDRILLYTDGASEARARGGFFPLQAAAAFALVSADLERGGKVRPGPSCNATSLGSSTTTSPCCSSNTAADRTPLRRQADGGRRRRGCRSTVPSWDQAKARS